MALKGGEEAIEMRMEGGLITSQMDGGEGKRGRISVKKTTK